MNSMAKSTHKMETPVFLTKNTPVPTDVECARI